MCERTKIMKITLQQIKDITIGAAYVDLEDDNVVFHRFTKPQEELYEEVSRHQERNFYDRCHATAGIRMRFVTDSRSLSLSCVAIGYTSRNFFSADIFVNGVLADCVDNFSSDDFPQDYADYGFPLGEFSKTAELGEGEKEVCIYFPWSVGLSVRKLELDDGAYVKSAKREKILLAYGDSITQGYDALRPSNRYASLLADMLGADEYNKGIGGEFFFPPLATLSDNICPDYITVAYGTNDWSKRGKEEYESSCIGFYKNLCERYPDTPVFAISPIWRKDCMDYRPFGSFDGVHEIFRKMCEQCPGVTLINPWEFVPHDVKYYSDLYLHPNDEGFEHYAKGLIGSIVK